MTFKKDQKIAIIFPATAINEPQFYKGQVIKITGPKEFPYVTVASLDSRLLGHLEFRGSTGKGLGNEGFIIPLTQFELIVKEI